MVTRIILNETSYHGAGAVKSIVAELAAEYADAGSDIILKPGESLTLYPYYYHEFIIPEDRTNVLIGEVSMCNDDNTDNRFYEPLGRFPTIEEDEPAYRLLCNEYPPAKD